MTFLAAAQAQGYKFTADDFSMHLPVWDKLLEQIKPQKILEIGSAEGVSACYTMEQCLPYGNVELHCIDTFMGGAETENSYILGMEERFRFNANLKIKEMEQKFPQNKCDLRVYKGTSYEHLGKLIAQGLLGYFDMIYVDGSHQTHDVLADCAMAFPLLRNFGLMILDDYLWYELIRQGGENIKRLSHPKPAIDAFININHFRLRVIQTPLYQMYLQKIAD